jgi:hypothetical protein
MPFVSFVSESEKLASYLRWAMAEEIWAVRNPQRNPRDGAYNIGYTGRHAADVARWLYQPCDIAIPRKAKAALTVIQEGSKTKWAAGGPGKDWTVDELQLLASDRTVAEVAEATGRSVIAVRARRAKLR